MALSASDLQTVFSLLANSLSSDESLRKPAESALAQCESRPGFCSCLLEIICSRDLTSQVDVRLMASLFFKNSITRYWRQRRDSPGITNDEKSYLRKKLILHLREENPQIALQLAVIISKIARIDYPAEWPELFSVLASQLQTADTLTSHRVFMVLYRILKELSTKRLRSDQMIFSQIASQLFDYCWKLWQSDVHNILQDIGTIVHAFPGNASSGQLDEFSLKCERWLLGSKIIRRLIISGYQSDTLTAEVVGSVKEVCPIVLNAIQSFLPYCSSFSEGQQKLLEFTQKVCIKLMKILVVVQSAHPYTFGDACILPTVTDFCLNKIANQEPTILSFDSFIIQCMVMVKVILECKEYKPLSTGRVVDDNGVTLEQRKRNISNSASKMLASILPNERVTLICNVLIRRYFVITANDLDEWNRSPELFHHEQDALQVTEKIRPCAEALYIVLFENYRNLLAPVVVSILHESMSACPALETDLTPRMLLKDAAYTAAAHVYYELSSFLNFDEWFNGTLSLELSLSHPNMRILHRKIAIILGQWVSEIKGSTRKAVYGALVRLLQHNDIAVRLASCRSLGSLIQDCNFSGQDFFDLLPACFSSCFKLVEDVQEFDSKVQVLNLISLMIEHAADKVVPFSNQLIEFFRKIWEESEGESLLQIQLLTALRNFVSSLGYQSPICYPTLLPILQRGIDINSPDELNLLEDSVLLWEATLCHAPSMVATLLDFFPYLVGIMERSFEHLKAAVNIMEDYIILGGNEFVNRHAVELVKILDGIVGCVNDKGLLSTLPIIDLMIQLYPVEAPPLISGILQKLTIVCLSGDDNNLSKTTVRAACGAILARLLVMNTNYLAHLTSQPSLLLALQQAGLSISQNVILCLVDLWIDKVDNVTVLQRKTYALALAIILTLRVPEVIDKLDEILSVCTGVILGGADDSSEESSGDVTSSMGSHSDNMGYANKEFRKKQIRASDPIRQLSLESILKENLQACANFHGEASFNAAINSIHPTALAQLKQALKMA